MTAADQPVPGRFDHVTFISAGTGSGKTYRLIDELEKAQMANVWFERARRAAPPTVALPVLQRLPLTPRPHLQDSYRSPA